jgi:hypothetical protein
LDEYEVMDNKGLAIHGGWKVWHPTTDGIRRSLVVSDACFAVEVECDAMAQRTGQAATAATD